MTEHDEKKTDITNDDNTMKQRERESAEILRECFDAQIMKKLEENPPEIPSYEQFSDMIDRDQRKLRRRRRRIAGIAACFIVAMLVSIFACSLPGADVDADNNPKEEIATDDGVIIEDGGWGSSDGEDDVWVTTDWEHINYAKQAIPELLIPEYIPESYEFTELKVEEMTQDFILCEYIFSNQNNNTIELEIVFDNIASQSLNIEDVERKLSCRIGIIYIKQGDNKIATMQGNDGMCISVIGDISDEEIVEIIEGLRT